MVYWTLGVLFIYLFGDLCHFQHCTGHIMMGGFVFIGNQYIQLIKVLYCKLPTIGKLLPTMFEPPTSEVGVECYHYATVAPKSLIKEACSIIMSTPLGGGYIIFAFSAVRCPLSDVRCPASRMVSAHLKEKY